MIDIALITLAIIVVVGFFVPDKYIPEQKPRRRRRRRCYSEPHGFHGWIELSETEETGGTQFL